MPACHRFFPPHIKLIGLDYDVLDDRSVLRDEASRKVLRDVGKERQVLPVIWAHHDDGNYLGRPYTPYTEFASRLADCNASGYGIIHWTTRPLDLFFTSHSRQVWSATKDEQLSATCRDMAGRSFGVSTRDKLGDYLQRWVTDAPKFARETGTLFMDRPLTNVYEVITGCRGRMELLTATDQLRLMPEQRDRVSYFEGLERFMITIHRTQADLQRSQALLKSGDFSGARAVIAECRPEQVIEHYARFSSLGGISRGEQGMVVALNLHWLVHYVQQRQALRLDSIRYKFGPTSHEPLAQTPGLFTYHFDAARQLWQSHGSKETGAKTFVLPSKATVTLAKGQPKGYAEICRTGIESDQLIRLTLRPITGKTVLEPGPYRVRLMMLDPQSSAGNQRVFTVSVYSDAEAPAVVDRVDIFKATGKPNRVLERSYNVTIASAGTVRIDLSPERGQALLCAAILEPVADLTRSASSLER